MVVLVTACQVEAVRIALVRNNVVLAYWYSHGGLWGLVYARSNFSSQNQKTQEKIEITNGKTGEFGTQNRSEILKELCLIVFFLKLIF